MVGNVVGDADRSQRCRADDRGSATPAVRWLILLMVLNVDATAIALTIAASRAHPLCRCQPPDCAPGLGRNVPQERNKKEAEHHRCFHVSCRLAVSNARLLCPTSII